MGTQVAKLPRERVNWQTVVNVKSDILFMSLNSLGLEKKYIRKSLGIDYGFETLYSFNNTVAYSKKDLDTFFNLLTQKFQSERDYLTNFPERVYQISDALLSFSRYIKIRSTIRTLKAAKLNSLFLKYFDCCALAFPIVVTSIPIEIIITGELETFVRKELERQGKSEEFETYIQNLTQLSSKETFFQKDYRGLLTIGALIQKDKSLTEVFKYQDPTRILNIIGKSHYDLYQRLKKHNEEYSWINMYGFRRQPFSEIDQINRLKDILDKNCKETLSRIDRKRKVAQRKFLATVLALNIGGNLLDKVHLLPELVYLRTYRFDIFTLSAYLVRDLFQAIATALGIQIDDLNFLTFWEISDCLMGKMRLDTIPLAERKKDYAVIQVDGQFAIISEPKELNRLYELAQRKKLKGRPKEIKGRMACKGIVRGSVKIVLHPTQITKVEKGDILVAPMTSPDFVVGMLRAAAIVTDHGGATCHAAIVSRELNLPCIVGTEISTQVLKDGDLVEVDATNGIVRLL